MSKRYVWLFEILRKSLMKISIDLLLLQFFHVFKLLERMKEMGQDIMLFFMYLDREKKRIFFFVKYLVDGLFEHIRYNRNRSL